MDVSNRKYKRKHPDSNPQDHFGAGNPLGLDGAGSVQNGVGVHPRTKRRRTLGKHFCQQDLEESTKQKALHEAVGAGSTGTESQSHRTEKQCRKKKSVSRTQVEVETLINSEIPSALSQDENGSFEGQNGAQGAQNARRRKSRKKKKKGLKDQKSGVGREAALEYLHLWEDERSSWCFKKKAQFWLLQNMYEEDQVSCVTGDRLWSGNEPIQ